MVKIKAILIFLTLVIVIPFSVNFICQTITPVQIIGKGEDWLGFWGSYLGGITAVYATIYVLYKNHFIETKKKEYEIQEAYFESLCKDLGKLCSSIDISVLAFYIMQLNDKANLNFSIEKIAYIERQMIENYNQFCLLHGHHGGEEKELLLEKYKYFADLISAQIDLLLVSISSYQSNKISDDCMNNQIATVCHNLENTGDVTSQLYPLALKWKNKEKEILESKRKEYTNE